MPSTLQHLTLEFDYQPYATVKGESRTAPLLPVRLISPQSEFHVHNALIDTGTTWTTISREVFRTLFPREVPRTLRGPGASVDTPGALNQPAESVYICLEIRGIRFPACVMVLGSDLPIPVLLGRKDFSCTFNVRTNERDEKILLTRDLSAAYVPSGKTPFCDHTSAACVRPTARMLRACFRAEKKRIAQMRRSKQQRS